MLATCIMASFLQVAPLACLNQQADPGNATVSAISLIQDGRFPEAEAKLLEDINTKVLAGIEGPGLANDYRNLAICLRQQGRYDEAQSKALKAIRLRLSVESLPALDTVPYYETLASIYESREKYQDALELLDFVAAVQKQCLEENDLANANTYNNFAHMHMALKNYKESLKYVNMAKVVFSKSRSENLDFLANNEFVESQLRFVGAEFKESKTLLKQCLEHKEAIYGKSHPILSTVLNALVIVCACDKAYDEAEAYSLKSFAIIESRLGKSHPDYAVALTYHGYVRHKLGDDIGGAKNCENALLIFDKTRSPQYVSVSVDCLESLAAIYRNSGRVEEASKLTQRASSTRSQLENQTFRIRTSK